MQTVADLIAKLQTLDQTLPITVDGYEGGVDDEFYVEELMVRWDAYKEGYDYFGNHDVDRDGDTKVVNIGRWEHS